MRVADDKRPTMYSLKTPEKAVPRDHPLPPIKKVADEALRAECDLRCHVQPAWPGLRAAGATERLLKSVLLMALYSAQSERLFCEQLRYLLFKWFLEMNTDEE